jgi:membrane-associated phospholipid phosphatase
MLVRSSSGSSPNALRAPARIVTTVVAMAILSACGSDQRNVTGPHASRDAVRNGVPPTERLASSVWQESARTFVTQTPAVYNPIAATRGYSLLGVAQYLAVQRAEAAGGFASGTNSGNGIGSGGRPRLETDRGAVAGASAAVMTYLFSTRAQTFEDMVTAEAGMSDGESHRAFLAGEAIGRAVGATIVARAISDGFTGPNIAAPQVGPGYWTTSANPAALMAGGQLNGATGWFLTSNDQFRPGPPPAFGSADFNTALAEIRTLSDNRDQHPEQVTIAAFWALNNGTPTASGHWLQVASDAIAEHGFSEREATHVYALTSATMYDAVLGCWDAKINYWLIRPWRADPLINVVPAVGMPNHPSYPSGHSCVSSSGAEVLSTFFPEKRAQLDAMVTEAGLSRMYGGIHYRFDIKAGYDLGVSVAHFAIARDASGTSVLTAH